MYERWRKVLRGRRSGADLKPPQAAVVKSDGGERCGKVGTRFRQARLREASAGRLLVTMLAGIAEFEPELIRARTGEGRNAGHRVLSNGLLGAVCSGKQVNAKVTP